MEIVFGHEKIGCFLGSNLIDAIRGFPYTMLLDFTRARSRSTLENFSWRNRKIPIEEKKGKRKEVRSSFLNRMLRVAQLGMNLYEDVEGEQP